MSSGSAFSDEVWSVVRDPARLAALGELQAAQVEPDSDFDRLTRIAGSVLAAPIALVTLLDADRQWFKARQGLDFHHTQVAESFCAHTLASPTEYLLVPDALADERFKHNPFVTGPEHIRFYIGAPIVVHGARVGTLCVLDRVARPHTDEASVAQLVSLAGLAGSLFELKNEARVSARTAAALQKEQWQHALTLEAGMVGSWVWDLQTDDISANDILLNMFGLPDAPSHTGAMVFDAIHPQDLPRVRGALQRAFEEGVDYHSEFRVGENNHWVVARGRVYQRDDSGAPLVMMGINLDVNDTRINADAMRVLLRELNHRVKNTLAMIQSLARQTLKRNTDPQRFIVAFSGRLQTLADAHSLLADCDWAGINIAALVQSQVRAEGGVFDQRRVEVVGSDVLLPPDHALGLGIVLHELVTNAARFGALSQPGGLVRIAWAEQPGPNRGIRLEWHEQGGPPVSPPKEPGLGLRLIQRSLDKVLDSQVKVDFAPQGVAATISIPLPAAEA